MGVSSSVDTVSVADSFGTSDSCTCSGHRCSQALDNQTAASSTCSYRSQDSLQSTAEWVELIKTNAENTVGLIENFTSNLTHKGLDIVKILGGTMVLAGPVTTHGLQRPPGSPTAQDNTDQRTTRQKRAVEVDESIQDTLELVVSLLNHAKSATSDRRRLSDFTVGIALEQTINCMFINNNPSFELFGPAVNMAKAIADAAPAPRRAVATEKFAARAESLCGGSLPVTFGAGESWRLRDLGSVRVRTVRSGGH